MKQKNKKTYQTEKGTAIFDSKKFNDLIKETITKWKLEGKIANNKKVCEDLAQSIGYSEETFKRWKSRATSPKDLDCVKKVAKYFKVSYEELLIINSDITESEDCVNMNKTEKLNYDVPTAMDIPVNADKKWFIRDIYIDLCNFFTYSLFDEGGNCKDLPFEYREWDEYPIPMIKEKVRRFWLDIPQEALDIITGLIKFVENIPLFGEIVYCDINKRNSFNGVDCKEYFDYLSDEMENEPKWDKVDSREFDIWIHLGGYYNTKMEIFMNMAKEGLCKYFE